MGVMRKIINGKTYTVYNRSNAPTTMNVIDDKSAILHDNVVLPFRKGTENEPGVYDTGFIMPNGMPVLIRKMPDESEMEEYSTEKNFVNFDDTDSLSQYMANIDKERQMTENLIANVENIYRPVIRQNDDIFMKGFKQALHEKAFDINPYRDRFGPNFNNDKRSMEASSITLNKFRDIGPNLDMKVTVTFDNTDPTVPNPMKRPVTVEINNPDFDFKEAMKQQDLEYFGKIEEDIDMGPDNVKVKRDDVEYSSFDEEDEL